MGVIILYVSLFNYQGGIFTDNTHSWGVVVGRKCASRSFDQNILFIIFSHVPCTDVVTAFGRERVVRIFVSRPDFLYHR